VLHERQLGPRRALLQARGEPAPRLLGALVAAVGEGEVGQPGIRFGARVIRLPRRGQPERVQLRRQRRNAAQLGAVGDRRTLGVACPSSSVRSEIPASRARSTSAR
jgi:hypothetical protein